MARMATAEWLPDLATSKGFIFKGFTFERIALGEDGPLRALRLPGAQVGFSMRQYCELLLNFLS